MPFSRVGMRPFTLFGPSGLLSTAFVLKSTGKPTSNVKMIHLGSPFARFGLHVQPASTVVTSGFSITIIGSMTSANPGKVSSSAYTALVTATSANLNKIKLSTGLIPAEWIGVRSTKFTTAAGRALRVFLCAVPS